MKSCGPMKSTVNKGGKSPFFIKGKSMKGKK